MGRGARKFLVTALSAVALSVAGIGVAFAASGGGYTPGNQNCPAGASDFSTPDGQTYAGCHDVHGALESGQTQNGDPSGGNTHYADVGINQEPIDPGSRGHTIPIGLENLGEPGFEDSPHSGCISVNTDGTGAAPTSDSTKPTDPGTAGNATNGCGDNPNGFGFTANWDYYDVYCPLLKIVGAPPCEDQTPGDTTLKVDHGSNVDQSLMRNGLLFYFGADDNLDGGEHDGLGPTSDSGTPYTPANTPSCPPSTPQQPCPQHNNGAHNGSSDGGAILASVTPQNASNMPSATNPEGLANFSVGFCADGICTETTTQQQSVYQGCGATDSNGNAPCGSTPQNGNVYDYSQNPTAKEPSKCNSGDAASTNDDTCGPGGMNAYRSNTPANMNAEPGVQTYGDPDPQRSPIGGPFWPTPGIYAGTCGVYAGSPGLPTATAINGSPVGNGHGQVAINNPVSAC